MKYASTGFLIFGMLLATMTACGGDSFSSSPASSELSLSSSSDGANVSLYTETEYGTVTGGGHYEVGETVTITCIPNEGWQFSCWGQAAVLSDWRCIENPYVFTYSEPVWIMAHYAPVEETGLRDRYRTVFHNTLETSERMVYGGHIGTKSFSGFFNAKEGHVTDFRYSTIPYGYAPGEDAKRTWGMFGNIYQSSEKDDRKIFYPDDRAGERTMDEFVPDYIRPAFIFDMDMRFALILQDSQNANRLSISLLISDGIDSQYLFYQFFTENNRITSIWFYQTPQENAFSVTFSETADPGLSYGEPETSEYTRAYRVILRLPDGSTRDYGDTLWGTMPVLDPVTAGFSPEAVQGFYLDEAHETLASSMAGNTLTGDITTDVALTSTSTYALSATLADSSWGVLSVPQSTYYLGEIVTLSIRGNTYRPAAFSSFIAHLADDDGLSVLSSKVPLCIDPIYDYAVSFTMPNHGVNITL